MQFTDMPYVRPDAEELKTRIAALTRELRRAESALRARALLLELDELSDCFFTMATLAQIRHDIDTRDGYYDGEVEYYDRVTPELEEYLQQWKAALLESVHRPALEAEFGPLLFLNMELDRKTFSPEIIGELQRENALTTEYAKLLASARIPFEGGEYTISQMEPFRLDPDDHRRLAAWRATGAWLNTQSRRLDELFDELTALRTAMGRKLGQEGYIPLGYWRMTRNCYGQEDIRRLREAVIKYVVPLASDIYRRQAERLGKSYPMTYADNALAFRSGNPKPSGTPEDILAAGRRFYEELSPETGEFIRFMYDNGLLDVLSRTGKAGGGYCTELPEYKAPFIFANFNGTAGDVEVITHEAGHAFAAYTARDMRPAALRNPTMESCEVHSMSMEFFAWPWTETFFGGDARKFRYTHLSGALCFLPYGVMVDHFQHLVYEKPDMTPAERNGEWRRLTGIYMPWVRLGDEVPFFGEGRAWQRQLHIYEMPFYYIDYVLAQVTALQFWDRIQKEPKAAWELYMAYTRQAGSRTFTQLLQSAGLRTPFDETVLRDVCATAGDWLRSCDLTGIV